MSTDPAEIYATLRANVLDLNPAAAGLAPTETLPRVYGALMELGYPEGCATLMALADGTTSMYTSGGGGMIGAGEHATVAAATRQFLAVVEGALDNLIPPSPDRELPQPGRTIIRALTYDGPHSAEADEDDLGHRRHPLSEVFYAAQDVLTQMRLAGPSPH